MSVHKNFTAIETHTLGVIEASLRPCYSVFVDRRQMDAINPEGILSKIMLEDFAHPMAPFAHMIVALEKLNVLQASRI